VFDGDFTAAVAAVATVTAALSAAVTATLSAAVAATARTAGKSNDTECRRAFDYVTPSRFVIICHVIH